MTSSDDTSKIATSSGPVTSRLDSELFCKREIQRMLRNSQTKAIMAIITFGLLREFLRSGKQLFTDSEIGIAYRSAVKSLKDYLGHDVHFGAKYYDAYGSRMSRYGLLKPVGHLKYRLLAPYTQVAQSLCAWLPSKINDHINERLGVVPSLHNVEARTILAMDKQRFQDLVQEQIVKTPANFEFLVSQS